jgi:hypothetical protein
MYCSPKATWISALLSSTFLLFGNALAGPPGSFSSFPGSLEGTAESQWIAPYVLSSSYFVGGQGLTTIRWFDEKGGVLDEISGPHIISQRGLVEARGEKELVVYGTSARWALKIADDHYPVARDWRFAADGEMFIHQYPRTSEETMVDVYRSGKLVGSAGPFPLGWDEASLHENGLVTLTTGRRYQKAARQVIVIGPDAKILLQQNCTDSDIYPFPTGDGKGVLLEVDGLKRPPARFHYIGADGLNLLLDSPANGQPLCSAPSGDLVLFSTSIGETERFQLLHASTGKTVWEIPSPVRPYPNEAIKATIIGDRVLFLGIDVAAIDLKGGHVTSFWEKKKAMPTDARFSKKGDKIYIISDREFFLVDPSNLENSEP